MPREACFDLRHRGFGCGSQEGLGGHHETGCAPAALEGFVVAEALGYAGEVPEVGGEGFGGLDLFVGGVDSQHHAGIHGYAVDKDGAVPALAAVAADLGEGKPHLLAQYEVEGPVWLDVHLDDAAVDVEDGTGVNDVGHGGGDGGLGDGDCRSSGRTCHGLGDGVGSRSSFTGGGQAEGAYSGSADYESGILQKLPSGQSFQVFFFCHL